MIFSAIRENGNDKEIVPERYEVLSKAFVEVSQLTEVLPELKLYPNFASGSVTVEVSSLRLGSDGVLKLKEVLSRCNTFEILPLTNGKIRASVTVKGVFKTIE